MNKQKIEINQLSIQFINLWNQYKESRIISLIKSQIKKREMGWRYYKNPQSVQK